MVLFRGIRELLINVVKHGQANHVKLTLSREETQIKICVTDDGLGFESNAAKPPLSRTNGFGLFSLNERLVSLGGSLQIESKRGQGARISIIAPLEEA